MNVESILTEELGTLAGALAVPPPPAVADLVRRAEITRTRSRRAAVAAGTALVAAAIVTAVVLSGQLGKPSTSPTPAPSPTEAPTTFRLGAPLRTWVDENGVFSLNGVAVPGDWAGQVTSGDLTTAQEGPYDTGTTGVFIGTRRIGKIHDVAVPEIAVSPDHRTIAWVGFDNADRSRGALVVASVADDGIHELGRLATGAEMLYSEDLPRVRLYSVADDGTVLYGGTEGSGNSWKPGSTPRPADITAYQNGPDGFPATAAQDLQLNPTRSWGAWSTDVGRPATDVSVAWYTAVTVQRTGDPASRTKISFPARYDYVTVVGWESDTDLIVYPSPQGSGAARYLRCDVVDRSCEYAPIPSGD